MENEENKTGAQNSTQGSQEKMFTQEEVNTIIQNRLTREKEKKGIRRHQMRHIWIR